MRGASYERKFQRFNLRLPVHVRFSSGEANAISNNISIGGLLLESNRLIPDHSGIEFTITVGGEAPRSIILGGTGEVVRVERADPSTFRIAVACAQPLHQIERYLRPTDRA